MSEVAYIGRKQELKILEPLFRKKSASLVVLKGRRRIGKSRLAQEFAKQCRFLKFSGLPPTLSISAQAQRNEFMRQMAQQTAIPEIELKDWGNAFALLASQVEKGRVVILFDEISWMALSSPDFLGKLKNAWDMSFKQNPGLILILCGSVSSWIEKNILSSTGFMGRISLTLHLDELNLEDSSEFIKKITPHSSPYDQFKILSVMGGVPRYLEEIISNAPANETLQRLCFTPHGILFREFEDIFSDLFSKKSPTYQHILKALVDGKREFTELCEKLELTKSGSVTEYLNDLVQAGFIKRDFTWNIKDRSEARLSHYRISDNYVRFYLKYIMPNRKKIEAGHFNERSIENLPNWDGIIGLQFENLVLHNRSLIWQALGIQPNDIVIDNPFFQRKTLRAKGCQIDYMIQTKYNALFICEVKFSQKEITHKVITEVKDKIERISLPNSYSCWPVLIHINGVNESIVESEYFTKIIDFSEFLR